MNRSRGAEHFHNSKPQKKVTRQKVRFRLVLAFPMLTTLLVLGLGYVIVDVQQRQLLNRETANLTTLEIYSRINHSLDSITVIIIIAAAIAFVSGVVLALTVTNPIKRIAEDTASIARGDLTRNIRLNADGELAILGTALNEMVASINRYMLQSMSGGMIIVNDRCEIVSMSGDAELVLGVTADRIVGGHIKNVFPDAPQNKLFHEIIEAAVRGRKTSPTQQLLVTTDERTEIPITMSTSLLRDMDDTLIGLTISFEDVKQLRRIEEQIRRVDRLTTLGGLAASVAHQVRNPLCSIRGLAQLIRENRPEDQSLSDYSNVILSDVDRIDQVITRLMNMLQPTQTDWTLQDVNDILKETVALARHEIRDKEIEISEQYSDSLPVIYAQRENLIHAFLNIVVNALQAIEQKGRVEVRTKALASVDKSIRKTTGILVEIEDDGPGISPETLNNIFSPGFTTKDNGSGFGLTITRQTFEAHGGEVSVKSAPGSGATFSIWLPLRDTAFAEGEKIESVVTG